MVGPSALGSAWTTSTRHSGTPLSLAISTYSDWSTSIMEARIMRIVCAQDAASRVTTGQDEKLELSEEGLIRHQQRHGRKEREPDREDHREQGAHHELGGGDERQGRAADAVVERAVAPDGRSNAEDDGKRYQGRNGDERQDNRVLGPVRDD